MPPSRSPTPPDRDYVQELQDLLAELTLQPDTEPAASEIAVLQSIYGDEAVRLWRPTQELQADSTRHGAPKHAVRYEVKLSLSPPHDETSISILVSIPPTYPATSPPQLQLLSRYIGSFGADSSLFGNILRTYMSISGVEWTPDTVCVFDGLQRAIDVCTQWYEDRLSLEKAGQIMREDERRDASKAPHGGEELDARHEQDSVASTSKAVPAPIAAMPDGIQIFEAEPITDRRSAFVGRACRISRPSEVPIILSHLMSDRKISRAAHPIINAWRCQVGSILHQDNDDDGETAAGGRLAHLLQILDVNDVLIVVTRYFGGIHLGPDRFKHINQAARNALELGGFLDAPDTKRMAGRAKKR
ncbi:hypothetical protein HGRIS_010173 [Hohenbuehelia grisea]|uniref:RWD domain-containing protein n=1 Tax=Hohenbuehelia grisea TaxID=104357 RepID=A0ABR3J3H1_9AGAR